MKKRYKAVTICVALIAVLFCGISIYFKKAQGEGLALAKLGFSMNQEGIAFILNNQAGGAKALASAIEESKKKYPIQTYWYFYDLPFKSLSYIEDNVYEDLKQIYAQIDYTSEFERGDLDSYDFYIEKYRQLVNNEIAFYDAGKDEEYYLNQYEWLKDSEHSRYDLDKYTYFFFDMDGDGCPELGVTEYVLETKRFIYFFKYDVQKDRMIMWDSTWSSYTWIMGSRKIGGDNGGRYYWFDQLDADGKLEIATKFVRDGFFANGELIYLATFPWSKNEDSRFSVTAAMKRQGYYTESENRFYFRITEEQFKELTERYFQAEEEARENIKEVSYTYKELFGNY